ncbi:hypothetical protein CLPUN_15110 [Clostridium puniceum]|uniref:Uncharacterized protein n=1 Tax=Clostridium puniceum TaxID=29367 RepID=A0A1S8TP45_9CLOT|nr:hypothetical protein [Clostridium puniceum]OOM79563.1 hypothetical protein CLPUN_15110 [Clostridium puniceum]
MSKGKKIKLINASKILGTIAVVGGFLAIGKKIKNNRVQKSLENEEYSTGNTRFFGTLYLDDGKEKTPVDFQDFKDIPVYTGQKIEIRDTDKNHKNKLSWIEINDNNKKLLICDRNILKEVTWNELNQQNLIFGRVVIIDGKKYILRLLTGSNEKQDGKVNEWDKYVVNVDNIVGLPVSADYETDYNSKDDENNDNLWHWYNFASYTQSEGSKGKKLCVTRGFSFVEDSNESDKDLKYETVGYRPVLELLE